MYDSKYLNKTIKTAKLKCGLYQYSPYDAINYTTIYVNIFWRRTPATHSPRTCTDYRPTYMTEETPANPTHHQPPYRLRRYGLPSQELHLTQANRLDVSIMEEDNDPRNQPAGGGHLWKIRPPTKMIRTWCAV